MVIILVPRAGQLLLVSDWIVSVVLGPGLGLVPRAIRVTLTLESVCSSHFSAERISRRLAWRRHGS